MKVFALISVLVSSVLVFNSCSADETLVVTPELTEEQQALIDAINTFRLAGGQCNGSNYAAVGQVQWNVQLEAAGLRHAEDMSNNDFFDHTGTDGTNVGVRAKDAGYNYSWIGENLATGFTTVEDVMEAWRTSTSGHCEMMLNENFTEVGVARVENLWVMVLAAPL